MFARDQAPQCPLVNGLRWLLVSKTMFAHDQTQLPPCSARLCSVCPLPVLVCLPAALLLPVESALYQTVGRAVGLPDCLTVACAPIIARRPQLHVYPLLKCVGILLVYARTRGQGCGRLDIN